MDSSVLRRTPNQELWLSYGPSTQSQASAGTPPSPYPLSLPTLNPRVRGRHDLFDATGLRVKRATSVEPCSALAESYEAGLPACWTTFGDGHLGVARDSSDRVHVVRAVKKAQLQLAIALDAPRVVAFFDNLGEREQIAFADFFDPIPWWTMPRRTRRTRPATVADARALVKASVRAVERLREGTVTKAVVIGTAPGADLLSPRVVALSLDPCVPDGTEDAAEEGGRDSGCGEHRSLALGSVGASLVRPLLVELPAAQDDVTKLEGEADTDHGLTFQLLAAATTGAVFPRSAPIDLYAPGLGGSMGLAYRFGTYLPGRRNRSAVELNLGISTALHYDTRGRAGGHPIVTIIEQEVRWPILWEALTSYALPFDLRGNQAAGSVIVLGGARVREVVEPLPKLWGIDVEIFAFALSSGRGAYPLYTVSPELRVHFGFADPSVTHRGLDAQWAPTMSLSFVGGYATFL